MIRGLNGIILCVLGASFGALTVASAMPQYRKLQEKREEYHRILEEEGRVVARKEDAKAASDAMREDPEYLELHAIDRLNLYRPGTRIYRIEHEQ